MKATRLLELKPVRKLVEYSRKIVLPGFDGLPLYTVAVFFFKGVSKGSITARASSIAFSFFLAMFPMIIVFFTMIPFIPIENFQNILMGLIERIAPDSAETVIRSTLIDIVERPRGGLLSVTFFLAMVFATNGFSSVIEAFNNTYHAIETRSWIKQKLISTLLFLIISFIVIIVIALLTAGGTFINFLKDKEIIGSGFTSFLLESTIWILLTAMFFFTISFIFYLAPAKESKFRFISAGSSLATLLSLIASVGFNFYVQNFSSYNALYGSIGTLLIILVWIYFNSIILLIGFELNASIQEAGKSVHAEIVKTMEQKES